MQGRAGPAAGSALDTRLRAGRCQSYESRFTYPPFYTRQGGGGVAHSYPGPGLASPFSSQRSAGGSSTSSVGEREPPSEMLEVPSSGGALPLYERYGCPPSPSTASWGSGGGGGGGSAPLPPHRRRGGVDSAPGRFVAAGPALSDRDYGGFKVPSTTSRPAAPQPPSAQSLAAEQWAYWAWQQRHRPWGAESAFGGGPQAPPLRQPSTSGAVSMSTGDDLAGEVSATAGRKVPRTASGGDGCARKGAACNGHVAEAAAAAADDAEAGLPVVPEIVVPKAEQGRAARKKPGRQPPAAGAAAELAVPELRKFADPPESQAKGLTTSSSAGVPVAAAVALPPAVTAATSGAAASSQGVHGDVGDGAGLGAASDRGNLESRASERGRAVKDAATRPAAPRREEAAKVQRGGGAGSSEDAGCGGGLSEQLHTSSEEELDASVAGQRQLAAAGAGAGSVISSVDVVTSIGQQEFWRARKIILRQQRMFSEQVGDLHSLVKVQRSLEGAAAQQQEELAQFQRQQQSSLATAVTHQQSSPSSSARTAEALALAAQWVGEEASKLMAQREAECGSAAAAAAAAARDQQGRKQAYKMLFPAWPGAFAPPALASSWAAPHFSSYDSYEAAAAYEQRARLVAAGAYEGRYAAQAFSDGARAPHQRGTYTERGMETYTVPPPMAPLSPAELYPHYGSSWHSHAQETARFAASAPVGPAPGWYWHDRDGGFQGAPPPHGPPPPGYRGGPTLSEDGPSVGSFKAPSKRHVAKPTWAGAESVAAASEREPSPHRQERHAADKQGPENEMPASAPRRRQDVEEANEEEMEDASYTSASSYRPSAMDCDQEEGSVGTGNRRNVNALQLFPMQSASTKIAPAPSSPYLGNSDGDHSRVVSIAPRAVVATPESTAGILLSIRQHRSRNY
eukprot:SM000258S09087  [mRNA]  locus=s258:60806:63971:+ [translate_table: standard]